MLAAIVAIFFDRRAPRADGKARRGGAFLPLVLLLAVNTAAGSGYSLFVRYYMLEGSADSHSLFFFTNAFLVVGAVLVFLVLALRKPAAVRPSLDMLRPRMIGLIGGSTVLSNFSSLISAALVLMMDATVLTPVSSAITVLSAFAVTLLLRERCGRYGILAAVLALAAHLT
jgi:drug/metabolite transporter (DMT)-like permease